MGVVMINFEIPQISDSTMGGALIAIVGGVLVRWLDKTLRSKTETFSESKRVREELREEITTIQEKLDTSEENITEWKDKYYTEVEEHLKTKTELSRMSTELHNVNFDIIDDTHQ